MGVQLYWIKFSSDIIIDKSDHPTFVGLFNKFGGLRKVYLDYNKKTGQAYYYTKADAFKAFNELNKDRAVFTEIEEPEPYYYKGKSQAEMEEELFKYDLFGNKINVCAGPDGQLYIPLSSVIESGYLLFDEDVTKQFKQSDNYVLQRLNCFLLNQAQIFINFDNTRINLKDVKASVNRTTSEVLNDTKQVQPARINARSSRGALRAQESRPNHSRSYSNGSNSSSDTVKSKMFPEVRFQNGTVLRRPKDENKDSANDNGWNVDYKRNTLPTSRTSVPSDSSNQNTDNKRISLPTSPRASVQSDSSMQNAGSKSTSPRKINLLDKLKIAKITFMVKKTYPERNCITDQISNNQDGFITFIARQDESKIIAYIVVISDIIEKIENIVPENYDANYKAVFGDTVAIEKEKDLYVRGNVLAVDGNEYKLALPDYGEIIKADKIWKLSDEILKLPELCVFCSASKSVIDTIEKANDALSFVMKGNGKIQIEGIDELITCTRWIPDIETKEQPEIHTKIQPVIHTKIPIVEGELKPNDVVLIAHIEGNVFYLRTKELNSIVKKICLEISEAKLETLTTQPINGQLVLAYSDNQWRRSVIKNINGSQIDVHYIDYGTSGAVTLDNLRSIDKFIHYDGTIYTAKLNGYENEPFSQKALNLLNTMVKKEKFSVLSYIIGVIELKTSKNHNLAELLRMLDMPTYKRFQDMEKHNLTINEKREIIVLNTNELSNSYLYGLLIEESSELEAITAQLSNLTTFERPLNLHIDELCIAQSEDDWCRAAVRKILNDDEYEVYFIDFGNTATVSLTQISTISDDLISKNKPLCIKFRLQDAKENYDDIKKLEYEKCQVKILSKLNDGYEAIII